MNAENESNAAIRTPDQRLRVFVSSTLAELSPERQAARAAIESLRLSPVLFEAGARPHPRGPSTAPTSRRARSSSACTGAVRVGEPWGGDPGAGG